MGLLLQMYVHCNLVDLSIAFYLLPCSNFDKLFNGNYAQYVGDLTITLEDLNRNFMRRIRPCEVKEALDRMRTRKVVGSDAIPIEV